MKTSYDRQVFINCPFDQDYQPILHAIQFTAIVCGFKPRSALERDNAAHVRVEKIIDIMSGCCLGIHDISRTELDLKSGLPRFNMPYELGLFHGMARRGNAHDRKKCFLVLDRERYRYQAFLSDIAGQDIRSHDNQPDGAIKAVRNWLNTLDAGKSLPGAKAIARRYRLFQQEVPVMLAAAQMEEDEITFADWTRFVQNWLNGSKP